jgi:hypothetical protein
MPRNGRGRDMAKEEFSGNRGEWSEPYVVLRLMADGKLYQADKDMHPDKTDFAYVLSVNRGDVRADVRNNGVVVFSYKGSDGETHLIEALPTKLDGQARRLFKAICAVKKVQEKNGSFSLPDEVEDLKALGFRRLSSPLKDGGKTAKRDIELAIASPKMGHATLGFSVKSRLGSPATLLNASGTTNVVYRIKGLTKEQAEAINAIDGSRKVMDKCRAIRELATSIEYESYLNQTFFDNLELVDSALPKMIADLLKVYYFKQLLLPRKRQRNVGARSADRLSLAVELLNQMPEYAAKRQTGFCEVKIKRFLYACALGLKPSEAWNAKGDASGGYVVVLPDGQLVALFVYNVDLFEHYLFTSTFLERGSTSKHGFLTLVPDGDSGDYLLRLNIQIRFIQ